MSKNKPPVITPEMRFRMEIDAAFSRVDRELMGYRKFLHASQNIILSLARALHVDVETFAKMIAEEARNSDFEKRVLEEIERQNKSKGKDITKNINEMKK